MAGCFYPFGEPLGSAAPLDTICIAEGFATAATIREITGHAAVAAINRTSLLAIAQSFRKRFPAARIVLCADDDWMREREGKGNPGLESARAAAAAVGGVLTVPEATAEARRTPTSTTWPALPGGTRCSNVFEKSWTLTDNITLPPGGEATPDMRKEPRTGSTRQSQHWRACPLPRTNLLGETKRPGLRPGVFPRQVGGRSRQRGGASTAFLKFESYPWLDAAMKPCPAH